MDQHGRPDWDEYFLNLAAAVALRADCRRRQVGAVLVRNNRMVFPGYNGTAPGAPGCLSGACPRGLLSTDEQPPNVGYANCIATHAERNAIIFCPVEYRAGSIMYITHPPCGDCQTLMRAVGIPNAIYPGGIWYD